jgi:hypothetical protein
MANIAETKFTIRAVNKTQAAFSQIQRSVGNIDRKIGRLGSTLTARLAPAFASAFAGTQIVNTIMKFERLEASLKTVTGSAEKAAMAFKHIQDFAAKTPFQLEEVTASFIKLKALGLTPSEAALKSYGNTAIAMGKSLDQMIEAIADATTGEFERLKEFGIKARTQGEQVTFTFQGISTTVGKNAAEIEGYLRSIGEVQFAGAIESKANTLVTAVAKMKDSFSQLVMAIGDAGLTEALIEIANGIRWLADTITASIDPIEIACLTITAEIFKFGRTFIAVIEAVGSAFIAFVDGISARFKALGQDLAGFIEDPLSGVSFEHTREALETGLVGSMKDAFDKALAEADAFNQKLDEKLGLYKNELAAKREKKSGSLEEMFGKTTGNTSSSSSKGSSSFQAGDRFDQLKQQSHDTTKDIERDFDDLGNQMQRSIISSLDKAGSKFSSFGDLAKNILTDLAQTMLSSMFSGSGAGGGLGGMLGGLFGGGGGGSGAGAGLGGMFGGFFADGGKLAPGKFGIVGENGPELAFAGNSPLNIMPDMPNGGSVTINMNVQTPDIASFKQSSSQVAADVARQIERARRNL